MQKEMKLEEFRSCRTSKRQKQRRNQRRKQRSEQRVFEREDFKNSKLFLCVKNSNEKQSN